MDYDVEINLQGKELKQLKKKVILEWTNMQRIFQVNPKWHYSRAAGVQFVFTQNERPLQLKPRKPTQLDQQWRFAKAIVMILNSNGKPKSVRALLYRMLKVHNTKRIHRKESTYLDKRENYLQNLWREIQINENHKCGILFSWIWKRMIW